MFAVHWQPREYGFWLVELKETGELVGRVNLWQPLGWPGIELDWGISSKLWGMGLAQETATAALLWEMNNLKTESICSLFHPQNSASMKLAKKLRQIYSKIQKTI